MRMLDPSHFAMTPRPSIPRSRFDVESEHKTSFSPDYLIPFYVEEILPGDSFNVQVQMFARLAPTIVPVMDTMVAETFFFYCPNRLVWNNFQKFMGERENPSDSVEYLLPTVTFDSTGLQPGSLADYMGITMNGAVGSETVQAIPFRIYGLIWNEFFRDTALQPAIAIQKGDGPDNPLTDQYYNVQRRNKRPDYFTSARPWPVFPQPGLGAFGNSFTRPAAGVPVTGMGVLSTANPAAGGDTLETGGRVASYPYRYSMAQASTAYMKSSASASGSYPEIRVLVEDIRTSLVVQHYLEAAARGGTRYTEILQAIWGISPPDFRLQRPEYLGGGRTFVTVSPVTQVMASPAAGNTEWTTKMGEQAGIATINGKHGFSHSFSEHGWIIGMVMVRANLTYQQGNARMWYRRTPFDIFSPPLEGLGEQAILRREIYADGNATNGATVFGFQERWSEYKYRPSRTSGYMRSTAPTTLDIWHLGQRFGAPPVLNSAFISETMPLARIAQVAVNYGQAFIADFYIRESKTRAMRMYSIPGVVGRF